MAVICYKVYPILILNCKVVRSIEGGLQNRNIDDLLKAKIETDKLSLPYFMIKIIINFAKNKTMTEIIFIIEESPEGGYEARALGYSIFTEGETVEELKENIKEAIRCHFEVDIPKIIRLHYIKEEVIAA